MAVLSAFLADITGRKNGPYRVDTDIFPAAGLVKYRESFLLQI